MKIDLFKNYSHLVGQHVKIDLFKNYSHLVG